MRILAGLALALLVAGCLHSPRITWPDPHDPGLVVSFRDDLALLPFAEGLEKPVLLLPAGDGSSLLLVVEQTGRVWALEGGNRSSEPYLDLTDRVGTCHLEQGLLGLAFAPSFADDGRLYATYTTRPCDRERDDPARVGDLVLARFAAEPPNASRVDPATGEELLRIRNPYRNHNGGHILFGPDGFLYWGIGDGGGLGDPERNGQDLSDLLGSILRFDVSGASGYAVPPDNPFVGHKGSRGEVYVYGLRNPWRFDFDPATGDLWIADPGEDSVEEIDHLPAGSIAGANLGWSLFEGRERFRSGSAPADLVFPVADYAHDEGNCAVTGGPFLRNTTLPDLEAAFLFADFCSGRLWGVQPAEETGLGADWRMTLLMETGLQVTGFGRDGSGGVYLLHWNGSVHRLVAKMP